MGLGRCRTGTCSRSFNWWRNRGVILRLRVRLSVLRLWLRLPRLRLWLWICPGLCHVRLWLPGLWLWLWDRLLRRLQGRLSPRYPPPYLRLSSRPASLALLTEPLNFVRWSSLLLAPATGLLFLLNAQVSVRRVDSRFTLSRLTQQLRQLRDVAGVPSCLSLSNFIADEGQTPDPGIKHCMRVIVSI